MDRDDSEPKTILEEAFPVRTDKDEFRGFKVCTLEEGLGPVDGDLELDFLGNGNVSSGVWLNLSTRSFNDVCRFRAVFRVGLDFAALNGDLSGVEEE